MAIAHVFDPRRIVKNVVSPCSFFQSMSRLAKADCEAVLGWLGTSSVFGSDLCFSFLVSFLPTVVHLPSI